MPYHYFTISDLLDLIWAGRDVPADARRRLYAAADALDTARAPQSHARLAARAAFAVHWMEFALRHSAPADQAVARRELNRVRLAWQAAAGAGARPAGLRAAA
jgi:hypothetical protein